MIRWERQYNGNDFDLALYENKALVGWRLGAGKKKNTWQAEWAGRQYHIKKLRRFTFSFRCDDPETGLSCTLVFHWTGKSAKMTTNTGGRLHLKRTSLFKRTWTLYDGEDPIILLDAQNLSAQVPGYSILESPTRVLYTILVIHGLNYYYERTLGGYGKPTKK